MILLDTDHLSVLKYDEHPRCRALRERMGRSQDPFFATTIIAAEEQMRGWLAKIHGAKDAAKQVAWYDQLAWLIEFLADWQIIAFDQPAAAEFKRLQRLRLRIDQRRFRCHARVTSVPPSVQPRFSMTSRRYTPPCARIIPGIGRCTRS